MNAQEYRERIRSLHSLQEIKSLIDSLSDLKVLLIGDIIIDEYNFVVPKGRAIKDPILSVEHRFAETYPGGALAIANHLSTFVEKIHLISLLGELDPRKEFVDTSLPKNATGKFFVKEDAPTVVKKRYIDHYRNNKLFKIEYINDKPISHELSEEIRTYISSIIKDYDVVLVCDFGHGFLNEELRGTIEHSANFLAINVQSNSANMGYNYVNLYKHVHFMSLDEQELRLPLMRRFEELGEIIPEFSQIFGYEKFLVTLGKQGSLYINGNQNVKAPVLVEHTVDTVGAGDAVFSITSLLAYKKAKDSLIPFIANCAGGIKVSYMGNKEAITKERLLTFIKEQVYE